MAPRDQTIPPNIAARLDELEMYMRAYFVKRFERRHPIETLESALASISAMERARVFIAYPDDEFARKVHVKRSVWESLSKLYIAER